MQSDFLIVAALRDETKHHFEELGVPVLYTGLGKVNAAYFLAKEITRLRLENRLPKAVINFGTAGSPVFKTHELVECTGFVQRDIDLTPLGFEYGITPFEEIPSMFEVPKRLPGLASGLCGSGDSFETGTAKVHCTVVDMEAYALAKVCYLESMPFLSVKYITDGSDHNAHNDWNANLHKAAAHFAEIFQEARLLF